jgi:hypothetical protein
MFVGLCEFPMFVYECRCWCLSVDFAILSNRTPPTALGLINFALPTKTYRILIHIHWGAFGTFPLIGRYFWGCWEYYFKLMEFDFDSIRSRNHFYICFRMIKRIWKSIFFKWDVGSNNWLGMLVVFLKIIFIEESEH